jgi:Asp-tRNA(Asn)/Glu-tRNA(Gln) amidotransferase A subunit family amidase
LAHRRELIDPEVAALLDGALDQPLGEYHQSVFDRYAFRDKLRSFFEDFDLIVTPTLPTTAFDATQSKPPGFPNDNIVSWVSYTYPFNLTGNPAASIPCGFTKSGLPVGMQIVSQAMREVDIFRLASAFETARPWAQHIPSLDWAP